MPCKSRYSHSVRDKRENSNIREESLQVKAIDTRRVLIIETEMEERS
jgi:hypothetical protein